MSREIVFGFTGRGGGVSGPPFDSLNLGGHVGDDRAAVAENRARLARAYDFAPENVVTATQVHGTSVARVDSVAIEATRTADALVTATPGILLLILVADCLPVVFTSDETVGIAHAGWRGLIDGVLENTVAAMDVEPAKIAAHIGPGIGACCFEVGLEVAARFDPSDVRDADPRPFVDLKSAAARRLTALGLGAIHIDDHCTACDADRYFSHRRDAGRTGRQAGFVGIRSMTR